MKQALKNFGLGLVYFFLLPIFLCLIAIAGVYAIFVIIYYSIKGLIRFFRGEKFFAPLPEDLRVAEIKEYQASLQRAPKQPAPQPQPDNRVFIQQNYYPNPQQGQAPTQPVQTNFPQSPQPTYQQPYQQQYQQPQIQQPQPQQPQIQQQPTYHNQLQEPHFDNSIEFDPNKLDENVPHSDTPVEIDNASIPHQIIDISNDDNGGNDL